MVYNGLPLLSIIIPIYNSKHYLEKCIDSVIHQTYKNLQVILVNDGSTDGSQLICRAWEKLDKRIRVINKENGGVVSAKKVGFSMANGEYIGWVDSDDWVEKNYFEQMMDMVLRTDADMVAANLFHDIGVTHSQCDKNGIASGIYESGDIVSQMLYAGKFYTYGILPHLCSKLFRHSILKECIYSLDERISAGDDAAIVYPYILKAKKICVSDICGYHYVQHQDSITKKTRTDEETYIGILLNYLGKVFAEEGVSGVMAKQMQYYSKYMGLLRHIPKFDEYVLHPYGGIGYGKKVILYGAGVLGQQIHQYLTSNGHLEVLCWVDKNWMNYREKGFCVDPIKKIADFEDLYDYILIANIMQDIADDIRNDLLDSGVDDNKILWFDQAFLDK